MISQLDEQPSPLETRLSPAMRAALGLAAFWWLCWIGRSSLFFDEAYYWDWSRRLDFGYFDHPPLVAVLIRVAGILGGQGEFSVRLLMVACGAGTVALAAKCGLLLGGMRAGWLCMAMAATCPLFGILFDFAAPDAPLLLLWAATVYTVLLAATLDDGRYWYPAGALVGLALMAKYTAAFLVLSLLLYAAFSRRRWLLRREPYIGALLGLLIFSPNLWWNARHGWVSYSFQSAHGACVAGARAANYLQQMILYAQNQVTLVGPVLAVLLVAATLAAVTRGIGGDDCMLLLACCTVVIGGVFFALHGVRHWAAPGYFSAIVAAGVFVARRPFWDRAEWTLPKAYVALALLVGFVEYAGIQTGYIERTMAQDGGSGTLVQNAARVDSSLLRTQPHWPDAASMVHSVMARLAPNLRQSVVYVGDSYGTAAEMAFYLPGHPFVYSGANQYKLWRPNKPAGIIVYMTTDLTPGAAQPLPPAIRPSAVMPVWSGSSVAGRFSVTLLVNQRLSSGGTTLDDLLARTEVRQQQCQ